jgi:hypothetical protein
LAALQRPSWRSWNGLIAALRNARKSVLRGGGTREREKLEGARTLGDVLARLDEPLGAELVEALGPLSELTRSPLPKNARRGAALALPIALRNIVAHDAPVDPGWWRRAADATAPLVEFVERGGGAAPAGPAGDVSPWFLVEGDGA